MLAALSAWRESLVSLSGTNRLINFRPSKTGSVTIDTPDADTILGALERRKRLSFFGDTDAGEQQLASRRPVLDKGVLHSPRPNSELAPVLRGMMRRATTEFLDRGLSVLYLAIGTLHWLDVDDTKMISPLLLVPVKLTPDGPKGTPRLEPGDDENVVNPALALRLHELGITLPTIDELDDLNTTLVLSKVTEAVHKRKSATNWEVRPTIHLSTFSFAKEAMYRDLIDNHERIVQHPIIRALAINDPTKQGDQFAFDSIDPSDIDAKAPPETQPLVLDADSSQRSAIAAAVAGHTFVMDGPPGTGKSQTIANIIAALLHAGRTVLFVSEKIAALDVVRNRLSEAGLANFLLEVHSHKTSRKDVAAELLRVLDNETVDPGKLNALDQRSAGEKRQQLNNYANAMNVVRTPLNLSLHHVLGMLSDLADIPSAPVPVGSVRDLSQAQYQGIEACSEKLRRAWRPAVEGSSFLWREILDRSSLDIRLFQADEALSRLKDTRDLVESIAATFELHRISDSPKIVELVTHQKAKPRGVRDDWITSQDLVRVSTFQAALSSQIDRALLAERSFRDQSGIEWSAMPLEDTIPPPPTRVNASPAPIDLGEIPAATIRATAIAFERRVNSLRDIHSASNRLSVSLGLGLVTTFAEANRAVSLIELRESGSTPDRQWFTRHGLKAAQEALAMLRKHLTSLAETEQVASVRFTPEALRVPLSELNERFTHLHKGLKKLSGSYRADKKTVTGLLRDASTVQDGIRHLDDAIQWENALTEYSTAVNRYAGLLGVHWVGADTDFGAIERGFRVAGKALETCSDNVPPAVVSYLTSAGPDDGQRSVAETIRIEFDSWKSSLRAAPALTGRPELILEPITSSVAWLEAHVTAMEEAAARIEAIEAVTEHAESLVSIERLMALRSNVQKARDEVGLSDGQYRELFGDLYDGVDTNMPDISQALDWVLHLRNLKGGPLNSGQLWSLAEVPQLDMLRDTHGKWILARDNILQAFAPERHEELALDFDNFDDARSLIAELRDDTIGQDEWFAFNEARQELGAHGLRGAVDFCIERRAPAPQVPPILRRALLRGWAEAVLQTDRRLQPQLASDRETLIEEFKSLDRQLIVKSTAAVIRAVNSRRPSRTSIGEPAVIRRQGMLKRRHLPVRELIRQSRTTALALKPCFMMSPLAVSQYLPPDMNFDVVIFDEASQVTPGDAINCIYRASAMILAGDDRQLPPTSFFERVVDDGEDDETDVTDFQSVLELAKGSGAFANLRLRWHYRSRHEDLIAFSNYKFYEGNLITYPSAHSQGDDVGLEFFHANGTYRRGGGADNPKEAAAVAARVIDHYTKRPELTLGVVTFSVAQTDAVVAALDKAREARPDLEQYFDKTNRLESFFVRSLESVQGDERDIIIFSIGYGPDEAGKVSTNFGVLNKPKGWRRLNVGITRARQRVEVVASMRAGDIPPSTNENVEFLRSYLDYAERGRKTLAIDQSLSSRGPESPFEESVLSTILAWGYDVEPQVGSAGFRVDLGVRHTERPGMFAIGIECDGYQYHSAPAARDRDRLREQILRGLGWELHRIWGTAWYRNRQDEVDRLRRAIETAMAAPADGRSLATLALDRPPVETVKLTEFGQPSWTTEYARAPRVSIPQWVNPAEVGNAAHLREPLRYLVRIEGPVHIEVVYERLREWWSIGRVSQRLRETVERALVNSSIARDGSFLSVPGRAVDGVRVPANGVNRKVDHVHLSEIALAAEFLLRDVGAEDREALVRETSRIFGWGRTGANVDRIVRLALDDLANRGVIIEDGGRIRLSR